MLYSAVYNSTQERRAVDTKLRLVDNQIEIDNFNPGQWRSKTFIGLIIYSSIFFDCFFYLTIAVEEDIGQQEQLHPR